MHLSGRPSESSDDAGVQGAMMVALVTVRGETKRWRNAVALSFIGLPVGRLRPPVLGAQEANAFPGRCGSRETGHGLTRSAGG